MSARTKPVTCKIGAGEAEALDRAVAAAEQRRSRWIADAVAERLVREGWLTAAGDPIAPAKPTTPPCAHRQLDTFSWGKRCKGCGKVFTGTSAP